MSATRSLRASGATRRFSQACLARFGSKGLLRLIASHRPDVVVSMFPQTTEVLGRLRAERAARRARRRGGHRPRRALVLGDAGRGRSPRDARGVDRRGAGDRRPHGGGALRARLHQRPSSSCRAAATRPRATLGLPRRGQDRRRLRRRLGRRAGSPRRSTSASASRGSTWSSACAAGTTRCGAGWRARYAAEPRVRVEGFTERMSDWLAAADALVHSTGGLTMLEAQMRGCPAISFGWGRGHVASQQPGLPPLRAGRRWPTPTRSSAAALRADAGAPRGSSRSTSPRCRRPRRSCWPAPGWRA